MKNLARQPLSYLFLGLLFLWLTVPLSGEAEGISRMTSFILFGIGLGFGWRSQL